MDDRDVTCMIVVYPTDVRLVKFSASARLLETRTMGPCARETFAKGGDLGPMFHFLRTPLPTEGMDFLNGGRCRRT